MILHFCTFKDASEWQLFLQLRPPWRYRECRLMAYCVEKLCFCHQ